MIQRIRAAGPHTAVLAAMATLLALGPGVASAAPKTQYDLLCQSGGSMGDGSWTITVRYSIDLTKAQWCELNCPSASPLTMSGKDVVLQDGPKRRVVFSPASKTVTESAGEGGRESAMKCKYEKFTGLEPKEPEMNFRFRPR